MATEKKPASLRDDAQRNALAVRKALAAHIKKYKVPPTAAELAAATGLSEKTVKQHRQRIPLGSGKDNVFQQLSADVLMAIYERATGYEHEAVKILTTSTVGVGSEVEEVPYTERYPPDPASAKLWFQLVEGFTEKSEKKHTGEVGLTMKFNYVAPAPPAQEGGGSGD